MPGKQTNSHVPKEGKVTPQPLDDEGVVLCIVASDCSMLKLSRVPWILLRTQAEVPNTARIYVDIGLGAHGFPTYRTTI